MCVCVCMCVRVCDYACVMCCACARMCVFIDKCTRHTHIHTYIQALAKLARSHGHVPLVPHSLDMVGRRPHEALAFLRLLAPPPDPQQGWDMNISLQELRPPHAQYDGNYFQSAAAIFENAVSSAPPSSAAAHFPPLERGGGWQRRRGARGRTVSSRERTGCPREGGGCGDEERARGGECR